MPLQTELSQLQFEHARSWQAMLKLLSWTLIIPGQQVSWLRVRSMYEHFQEKNPALVLFRWSPVQRSKDLQMNFLIFILANEEHAQHLRASA